MVVYASRAMGLESDLTFNDTIWTELAGYVEKAAHGTTFPASAVVDRLLQTAIREQASDVLFEPTSTALEVRFRIDGVYHRIARVPLAASDQLLSRVKVIARLPTHKREAGQEGRFTLTSDGAQIDLRVSFVSTLRGERLALRVLDRRNLFRGWSEIGLPEVTRSGMERAIEAGRGVVLVVGPAGSGKTTTLYAALSELHKRRATNASFVTIEDPVELELDFAAQIPVDRGTGRDFAAALRLVLRQDPEVLLVGEIRDRETAEVALEAGLTGHVVLATLHAGDAVEAVVRILDLGLPRFVVASALGGILSQRLLRKVCEVCGTSATPKVTPEPQAIAHVPWAPRWRAGAGCAACHMTTCRGRTAVAEWIGPDEDIRGVIREAADTGALRKLLTQRIHPTMIEEAWTRATAGEVPVDEVLRVFGSRALG